MRKVCWDVSYYSLHFLVSWNKSFGGKGNIAKNLKLDICAGKVWNSSDKTFWYKDHPSWFSVLYQLLRFTDLPPLYQMHRKWRTRHTRKKTANPQGALTRTEEVCVYDLWEVLTPGDLCAFMPFGTCYFPQSPGAKKISWVGFYFQSLYSMLDQLSNPGYVVSSLLACANSNIPGSRKEHSSCDP